MRRTMMLVATMALTLLVASGVALAASVGEIEPNGTLANAQNIDGSFSLDFDPNIGDTTRNTSTTIRHATVNGTGNDTFDYYSFTVVQAGSTGIFDVDGTDFSFDSYLWLYDSSGQLLAENDDSDPSWGQGGSEWGLDSYMEYTFETPGKYYIAVGSCCTGPVPNFSHYQLQVSANHACSVPTIEARPGSATPGTAGGDIIAGTSGADNINARGGNDIVCGSGGNDRIMGGPGGDTLLGEGGNDTIDGGIGRDAINGGAGTDKCSLGEVRRVSCELAIGPNV